MIHLNPVQSEVVPKTLVTLVFDPFYAGCIHYLVNIKMNPSLRASNVLDDFIPFIFS